MSTILSKYIDPATKTIFVGKEDWAELNQQYDHEFIKEQLIDEIMAGNIGFPHLDITYKDAAESFKKLCDYKCKGFLKGQTMTRYDYRYPIGDLYIDETLVGNDASNYFHQNARSEASGHNDPSPDGDFLRHRRRQWQTGKEECREGSHRRKNNTRSRIGGETGFRQVGQREKPGYDHPGAGYGAGCAGEIRRGKESGHGCDHYGGRSVKCCVSREKYEGLRVLINE